MICSAEHHEPDRVYKNKEQMSELEVGVYFEVRYLQSIFFL